MKKNLSAILFLGLFTLTAAGIAQADGPVVATASCNGADYDLILLEDDRGRETLRLEMPDEKAVQEAPLFSSADPACALNFDLDSGYRIDRDASHWLLSESVNGP